MAGGWSRVYQGRPTWVEIDLAVIGHNVRELKRRLRPETALLAVVKANGYGHGAVQVARTALANGARWLGVACIDEGIELRLAGISAPILILGYASPWEAQKIVAHRLTPTVNTWPLALALSAASAEAGFETPVHIKVDTGLGRFGLLPNEVEGFVRRLRSLPALTLEGMYTHFATADETNKEYAHRQFAVYSDVLGRLEAAGVRVVCRHVANSAATLDLPETHLDLVRCGITIYGLYPSASVSRGVKLRPALSLKSRVARHRRLPAGSAISYGCTYVTDAPTDVALVPVGYADGLYRALSQRGQVLIRGKRAPIVGRVCMDQCVVSLKGVPGVQEHDEVVIIGRQGDEEITAEEVAEALGTIAYEVVCSIGRRVPRVYLEEGRVVAIETFLGPQPLPP